ncbi:MAG TPA: ABC transporter permease [Candidatus Kapabacteria bacterium]|nr:ABC transporter permease [Candidatus Kapabacteria bacterium]
MAKLFIIIGRGVLNFFKELGEIVILLTNIIKFLPLMFKNRKIVVDQMVIVGNDSLPLVILIGSFTGAIAALQATNLFDKFNLIGVAKPFLGSSIATVVFTELTPVLTALVIAGRVGASMAAQIGTMQVTEQVDALEMMAIDKNRYLGMPRVIATLVMMPILAVFSNLVALIGGYALTAIKFDFTFVVFFDSVQRFFKIEELLNGLVKSFVFGGITAVIGVYVGFNTNGGAEGVGNSTVRAFTMSAAAILIIDALFGMIW